MGSFCQRIGHSRRGVRLIDFFFVGFFQVFFHTFVRHAAGSAHDSIHDLWWQRLWRFRHGCLELFRRVQAGKLGQSGEVSLIVNGSGFLHDVRLVVGASEGINRHRIRILFDLLERGSLVHLFHA